MKFMDMYRMLQERNPESIVLVRNGIFFVALEKSALALNYIFALRQICMTEGVCKCVIPVSQIKKYMDAMMYLKYSFILYEYDKNRINDEKVKLLFEHVGEDNLSNIELKQDCEKCWYKDKLVKNFEKDFMKLIEGYKDENLSGSHLKDRKEKNYKNEFYTRIKMGDYVLFEGKVRTSGKLEIVWFEKLE